MKFLCTAAASAALLCAGAPEAGTQFAKATDTIVFRGSVYGIACIPSLLQPDAGADFAARRVGALVFDAASAGQKVVVTLGDCALVPSAPANGWFYQSQSGRRVDLPDVVGGLVYVRNHH